MNCMMGGMVTQCMRHDEKEEHNGDIPRKTEEGQKRWQLIYGGRTSDHSDHISGSCAHSVVE